MAPVLVFAVWNLHDAPEESCRPVTEACEGGVQAWLRSFRLIQRKTKGGGVTQLPEREDTKEQEWYGNQKHRQTINEPRVFLPIRKHFNFWFPDIEKHEITRGCRCLLFWLWFKSTSLRSQHVFLSFQMVARQSCSPSTAKSAASQLNSKLEL